MKIKVLREDGQEILIDTTRDAVAILLSPHEREKLSDVAKVQDTMLQIPYKRMNMANAGSHDLAWWQLWAVRDWGDHLEGGKREGLPLLSRIRALVHA